MGCCLTYGWNRRLSAVESRLMKTEAAEPQIDRERRLALARQAFRDFKAQCFWSWVDDPEITEETIPHIIRELRLNGGHRGYRVVAELCR